MNIVKKFDHLIINILRLAGLVRVLFAPINYNWKRGHMHRCNLNHFLILILFLAYSMLIFLWAGCTCFIELVWLND